MKPTLDLAPAERYLIDFDTREIPRYATDVLVVGGGVAGLSAALAAAPAARVLVLLKDGFEGSNTAWAQGGIAAAVGRDDRTVDHATDTLRTGCGLCDPEVVQRVVDGAPAAIERLTRLGAHFDREGGGGLALGREGGHTSHRIVHAHGDATGAECTRVLVKAVRATPGIRVLERVFVIDFLTAENRCVGVLARRPGGELVCVFARSVVLAAGGAGRLFRETTNARGATGDGIAAAFRAGATVRDLEFVQFHPTTLYLAGSDRVLVTEAVRGEGAHLVDDQGRRFLQAFHPDGELAPRDVVSRAILEHLARPDVHDVFLDLTHLSRGYAKRRFPGLAALCARYGLDPEKDRIPVRPAAHYFIGGVACDRDGRTDVPGLFACGEAACSGLHGANRLASNSLLEGLVLGTATGKAAALGEVPCFSGEVAHRTGREGVPGADLEDLAKALASRMWRSVGIVRTSGDLAEAVGAIERWSRFSATLRLERRAAYELENLLRLGGLVARAALLREESRGTHWRRDFPDQDDARFCGHVSWRAGQAPAFCRQESTVRG